ncbi:cupredoxin domain-containing protein [Niabella hibiscisoli]|uniref:hypothetical protein n=1 Tax=Niabella hibiscisoli TaxID=1825928 RepID=UPI001F10D4E6|nr:hypothetical protein [Niabella hibiscisoli]MCH5716387.1 hypothetical protein [Niabella hibiscisoli]
MLAMDVSDVYYNKVLLNGKNVTELKSIDGRPLKAGDKVRLRISNGVPPPTFGCATQAEK